MYTFGWVYSTLVFKRMELDTDEKKKSHMVGILNSTKNLKLQYV